MALTSPGVEVKVIDESFYTPAEPGTTPMIFVASASNKLNASGTGTAQGTLKANAGKPYLLTSQRDLADTFGDPLFYTDNNNNPIHAGELNEYGLQAAYSYLGVSNRAWVVRADIDLAEIQPSSDAPASTPAAGTYWLDTQTSQFGIQEWNGAGATTTGGQTFTSKTPIVITDSTKLTDGSSVVNGTTGKMPKATVGAIGDYAVVFGSTIARMFYRNATGTWVLVGSEAWTKSWATVRGNKSNPSFSQSSTTFTINGTTVTVTSSNTIGEVATNIVSLFPLGNISAAAVDGRLEIYSDGTDSAEQDSSAVGSLEISGDSTLLGELGIASGTYYPPELHIDKHTRVPAFKASDSYPRPTGSVWIKTTEPGNGARWRMKVFNDATKIWDAVAAPIYSSNEEALYWLDKLGGGANIAAGDVYVQSNVAGDSQKLATFKVFRRNAVAPTTIIGAAIGSNGITADTYNLGIQATAPNSNALSTIAVIEFTTTGAATDADVIAEAITNAGVAHVNAEVTTGNKIVITHAKGGDVKLTDDGSTPVLGNAGFAHFANVNNGTPNLYYEPGTDGDTAPLQLRGTLWKATINASGTEVAFYTASDDEVTALTTDGALWYNSIVDEVDIMIHNGDTWVGYHNYSAEYADCDPNGPIVSASTPLLQSDGTALVNGDLWISTADLENYPLIYRYNADLQNTPIANRWILLDKADQTSENGVLFADARYNTAGANSGTAGDIDVLLTSNYLDPDAPDPALYPKGMLLWNLRRSGFNVKKFVRNYIDINSDNERLNDEAMGSYYPHRWVTESGNQGDGSGSFGRMAQRKVVVQALQAMLNSNDDIRDDESRIFNLMATPGYPELIGEMITLNYDRGLSAFVIGDTPARLKSDATSLNNWATNQALAPEDNDDGLTSRDEYFGIFYPWGFTSDNAGNNVVVPPSHMMLRTVALSDQVSYPWFAPAGTRRGGITNATATGFVDAEGEFVTVALNEGQRDTLYAQAINPITFISGAGLVNYGQKTRARGSSALDRINVARLVIYLRSQLNQLAKPYIFEPNDKITRDEIKQAAESLMLELVGQRALYDFLVVCDESNNTPSRVDRNELYLDIAIEPVKAVEFIYIPLRLKNTGEIAGL
jgi:hypothetical protein